MQTPQTLLADPPAVLRSQAERSESYAPERLDRAKAAATNVLSTLQIAMPHRFSSMYPTHEDIADAVPVWAVGFIEARLTKRQIDHGIKKALASTRHCPDLPTFIELCRPRPEDLGLPTVQEAYDEACRNSHPTAQRAWSHPAVFHAAQAVGYYELRSLDKNTTRPQFESAYQRTVNAVLNGEELPEIPKAIEHQKTVPITEADKEFGRSVLADLKAMFK